MCLYKRTGFFIQWQSLLLHVWWTLSVECSKQRAEKLKSMKYETLTINEQRAVHSRNLFMDRWPDYRHDSCFVFKFSAKCTLFGSGRDNKKVNKSSRTLIFFLCTFCVLNDLKGKVADTSTTTRQQFPLVAGAKGEPYIRTAVSAFGNMPLWHMT